MAKEVGSYLYENNDGVISVNKDQVIQGGRTVIVWVDNPPQKEGAVGNFHTHPHISFSGNHKPSGNVLF